MSHWQFRAVDCDLAGHVNNAAYWAGAGGGPLNGAEPGTIDAEIEFRAAARPGEMMVLSGAEICWISSPSGELHASIARHLSRGPE